MQKPFDRSTAPALAGASWGRLARALLALALAATLAACSSVRFGYDHADTLLAYSFDRYFEFDSDQGALLRRQLHALIAWHRASQLDDYRQVLARWQELVDHAASRPLSAEDVLAAQDDVRQRLGRIGERAAPALARLALTLNPAQIEHCGERLAQELERDRRDLDLDGRRPLARRIDKYIERARDWLGPLEAGQEEMIAQALRARRDDELQRLAELEANQHALVALLNRIQAQRPAVATAEHWLRDYLDDLAQGRRDRAALARSRRGAELVARLVNQASPAQRQYAEQRLLRYQADLGALAQEQAGGERG